MNYKIAYKSSVFKDLKQIDKRQARRILNKIDTYLSRNPGKDKKLTGEYGQLYSYRIGDYRVIYSIIHSTNTILILKIGHRKNIY